MTKLFNIFAVALLTLFSMGVGAVEFPDKPDAKNYFVDQASLLDEPAQSTLNDLSASLLRDERVPLFVVTIPSLATYSANGLSIENYAQRLFDNWGIGSQDRNYGMLLLVSRGDRKARIEFGAGYGHRFDAEATSIMQSLIIPAFKKGEFATGIVDGARGLDAVARGLNLPRPTRPWWLLPLAVVAIAAAGFGIYNLFKTGRSGWAWALIVFIGAVLFFILRNAGSGSGGGFGGGSSGGGGATGSW